MEAAGQPDAVDQRMKVDESAFAVQKETEVVKIFSWRPRKDLGGSAAEKVTDAFKDFANFEDLQSDSKDWESGSEDGSVPTTNPAFSEMKITPQYEKEDWDKELADTENSNNPYDFEDVIHCGDFLYQDPAPLCSLQGQPLYDPSLDHVAPLTLSQIEAVLVEGQFDDAVD